MYVIFTARQVLLQLCMGFERIVEFTTVIYGRGRYLAVSHATSWEASAGTFAFNRNSSHAAVKTCIRYTLYAKNDTTYGYAPVRTMCHTPSTKRKKGER